MAVYIARKKVKKRSEKEDFINKNDIVYAEKIQSNKVPKKSRQNIFAEVCSKFGCDKKTCRSAGEFYLIINLSKAQKTYTFSIPKFVGELSIISDEEG